MAKKNLAGVGRSDVEKHAVTFQRNPRVVLAIVWADPITPDFIPKVPEPVVVLMNRIHQTSFSIASARSSGITLYGLLSRSTIEGAPFVSFTTRRMCSSRSR